MRHSEQFTKFPNKYIRCNISEKFGINRKFYITYLIIDKYRTIEDYSWLTISEVLSFYDCKKSPHKPKAFYDIVDVLKYMERNNMIVVYADLDSVTYNTGIKLKVISENFDAENGYFMITSSQLDFIRNANTEINKENAVIVFMYILSNLNNHSVKDANIPSVFYQSLTTIANTIGMAKSTISQCLEFLAAENSLLIKESIPNANIPNIYTLNKPDFKIDVMYAKNKLINFAK